MIFKTTKAVLLISVLSLFLLLGITNNAKAQKFMIGYGLSIYSELAILAPEQLPSSSSSGLDSSPEYGVSVLSVSVEMKYNIHEFNSELALSVATSPSFGFMSIASQSVEGNGGFGNIRIPLYAQLDFGNLSTFESMKNFGVGLGIGYEFDMYNMFVSTEPISFGTVAGRLGLRYFNRNNKSREIAFKVGLPKTVKTIAILESNENGDLITQRVETETKITSIQLSWIMYFNY